MTLQEFIQKYDGEGIDYDGHYGDQCMDLYRQYVKEVLKVPQSPPVPSAKDVWDTYLTEYYDRIENSPSGVPRAGDIVIWGDRIGKHGHIAIFVEGNAVKFKSFDQNFPTGSKCHIQEHTYKAVLGWLAPKQKSNTEEMGYKWLEQMYIERGIDLKKGESMVRSQVQDIFDSAKKEDDYERRIQAFENEIVEIKEEAAAWEARYELAEKSRGRFEEEAKELKVKVNAQQKNIDELNRTIDKLKSIPPMKVYKHSGVDFEEVFKFGNLLLIIEKEVTANG